MLRAGVAALAFCVSLAAMAVSVVGLDHVPVAVNDLDAAVADYRRLGFAIKPGRAHDNGIRNFHVKFRDGTEIELITAPEGRDALTARYRAHLSAGDGPAFLALFTRERDVTIDVPYIFFGQRNASPTDSDEHFAHANGARSLIAVWIADAHPEALVRRLVALGGNASTQSVMAPHATEATVVRFSEGEIVIVARESARPIIGVVVSVADIHAAQRTIRANGIKTPEIVGRSLFLPPSLTHGFWLELRSA